VLIFEHRELLGKGAQSLYMIHMNMTQADVTNSLEAIRGKNLRHRSSVEEHVVIDEKGGRATPLRYISIAAEHFKLHVHPW
jgi:hypothetical protein